MASQISSVSPGQVITAQLMNQVIAAVNALQGATGQTISSFSPATQLPVGQVLTINGSNFAFPPTGNQVFVAGQQITAFQAGCTSSQLIFIVPPSIVVPSGGMQVVVSVGAAQASYLLTPAIASGPAPAITNVVPADTNRVIAIGNPINIQGSNFAATPAENVVTFVVTSVSPSVTYPSSGQPAIAVGATSTTTQLEVTVPAFTQLTAVGQSVVATVAVNVGQQPQATFQITVYKLS